MALMAVPGGAKLWGWAGGMYGAAVGAQVIDDTVSGFIGEIGYFVGVLAGLVFALRIMRTTYNEAQSSYRQAADNWSKERAQLMSRIEHLEDLLLEQRDRNT